MDSKKTLRKNFTLVRKTLDRTQKSLNLCMKLRKTDIYKHAENIMLFYPLQNEVDTLFLLPDNKNFYLPKVDGENLLVCPYKQGDKLELSKFSTFEPVSVSTTPEILDLIIVPALAVDKNNYRLGYGGGFYDKFISQNPDIKTVVLIPSELVVDKLPIDEFDKKVDFIITC